MRRRSQRSVDTPMTNARGFLFLLGQPFRVDFAYQVRGCAIQPVRKSGIAHYRRPIAWLNRTEHSPGLTDISSGIPVGMFVLIAVRTVEIVSFAQANMAACMMRLTAVRGRNLFNRNTAKCGFIAAERLKLIERPIVPVLAVIRLGFLSLFRVLAYPAQVLQANRYPFVQPTQQSLWRSCG